MKNDLKKGRRKLVVFLLNSGDFPNQQILFLKDQVEKLVCQTLYTK